MLNNLTIWLSYVSYPVTTAVYFERALRKKHNVITIGPQLSDELINGWNLKNLKLSVKPLDIPTSFQLDLKEVLKKIPKVHHPDLFIWIESVPGFFPQNIGALACPSAGLFIDTHLNFPQHLELSKNFDFNFIVHRQFQNEFYKNERKNVFWLPVGCDSEIHSKRSKKKLFDVGFVGSLQGAPHKRRNELLNKINSIVRVNYKRCFWDEMAEFFSASKIVFNNAIKNDLNMRLFEAMSTGSFLLTDLAVGSGQKEMFKNGEDIGIYTDENITDKVKYFLSHGEEREKIAEHGQQIVHKAHTYAHRAEELINVSLGKKSNTPSAEEWREKSISNISFPVASDLNSKRNGNKRNTRSFVIPVLDMSPSSPYNISKLLDDLNNIPGEVIVVFNSIEMAEKLKNHPRIDNYAAMKKNVGVSRAWNIGLNMSQTPVTFLFNSDLNVSKDTVEAMEENLLKLPSAAIVGPQGSFYNFYKAKDLYYFDKNSFNTPIEVDAVSGFLFAVKTDLFNDGTLKFDNKYTPCFFEEWDLGLQIKLAGLKSYIVPSSGYNHEWSGSIRALKIIEYLDREETAGEILNRNRATFLNKWNEVIKNLPEKKNILISNWAELMLKQAENCLNQNDQEKAAEIYKKVIEQYPDYLEALTKLAIFYYNDNKLEQALEYFTKITKINSNYKIPSDLLNGYKPIKKNGKNIKQEYFMKKTEPIEKFSKRISNYYENPRPDIQQLINKSSKKILDVGCGSGSMAFELKNNLSAEVWGIELDNEAAGIAASRINYVICDKIENALVKLPENYFDTIIFADVLEHLIDPQIVLELIKENLSPGGEVIASIPNIRYWPVVRQLIEGHWTYQDSGIMDFTHLRFFTLESIIEMFENAGYMIISKQGIIVPAAEIPDNLVKSFTENNLSVTTLRNESKYFQYFVKAKRKFVSKKDIITN